MAKAKPIPDGCDVIIPHLVVKGGAEAIEFYKKALGAVEMHRMPGPDGKRLMHAAMRIGKTTVFLADDFPEMCGGKEKNPAALGGTPVTLTLYVEDVDKAFQQAVAAGAKPAMPPMDMFWGDRYSQIVDPFGHQWALATHIEDVPPQELAARGKAAFAGGPKN